MRGPNGRSGPETRATAGCTEAGAY
jgi:hypothetical protein